MRHVANTGHSGNNFPLINEDANFIGNNAPNNSGYRPQQQGWNSKPSLPFGQQQGNNFNNHFQSSLEDLVYGQKQINDTISKKFLANDKILESMAAQLEGFNSVIKNQLSFNKMIETKVAQLAASCPNPNEGKLHGQPEVNPKEKVNAVTTRAGKSMRDPPLPQDASSRRETVTARDTTAEDEVQQEVNGSTSATHREDGEVPQTFRDFYNTTALPFPEQKRKPVADEQFGKFVEVIKKLYVNIPLLDAMQVPTYAKYIKDIHGNKKTLPTTKVVHFTEECSAAILDPLPEKKKKDPGCHTITCSIESQYFKHALCDLGASISVMPKLVYDKLNHHALAPTAMCLQLADQSVHYPTGIAENIPVKIQNFFIPVDFVVLDMEVDTKTPLILGRPFLSTANSHIDVRAREIQLNINGQKEKFSFQPKIEQCSQVKAVNQSQCSKNKLERKPKKKVREARKKPREKI